MATNRFALKGETVRVAEVCDQLQRARRDMIRTPSFSSAVYYSNLKHRTFPAKVEIARSKLELVK